MLLLCLLFLAEGKVLKDEDILGDLGLASKPTLYFKDLGPQIGWSTVSLIH